MHDPMTVICDIPNPFFRRRDSKGRRIKSTLATIWHRDPQRDGTDDSCGYCYPKLSKWQHERVKSYAWHEGRYPYFLRYRSKEWDLGRAEAEAIYRGLVLRVAQLIGVKMSYDEAARFAALTIHRPDCVDPASSLCFMPGYSSNAKEDRPEDREYSFRTLAFGVARSILKDRRPWWRHPRWHFWHWRVQIIPLQRLRRWLFDHCSRCGGRFRYGEDSVTGSWSGKGPIWHTRCDAATPTKEPKKGAP